jgi:Tfp pilus assembly protein FimT
MRNETQRSQGNETHGFTIMQMVVTIAIIAIVSTFGVLGIRKAQAEYRVQNSARQLAVYLEKARADAIRRHATPVTSHGSKALRQDRTPTT